MKQHFVKLNGAYVHVSHQYLRVIPDVLSWYHMQDLGVITSLINLKKQSFMRVYFDKFQKYINAYYCLWNLTYPRTCELAQLFLGCDWSYCYQLRREKCSFSYLPDSEGKVECLFRISDFNIQSLEWMPWYLKSNVIDLCIPFG